MTLDPAQGTFFDNLTREFRQVRATYDLDSDESLELMTVFVQSLPYQNQNLSSPKYPIETYYDREGDCDDKSMLLASLLAHEGYNVSLLYFGPEQHMAVGVACQEEGYGDTGYAYIETTRVSFVGSEAGSLEGNITLVSDPLVIPIGSGTKGYTRCGEIRDHNGSFNISARLELLVKEARGRSPLSSPAVQTLRPWTAELKRCWEKGTISDITGWYRNTIPGSVIITRILKYIRTSLMIPCLAARYITSSRMNMTGKEPIAIYLVSDGERDRGDL